MAKKEEETATEFLSRIGRKGGRSKSDEKILAVTENLKKAQLARLRRKQAVQNKTVAAK